jgi:hypothetical protein
VDDVNDVDDDEVEISQSSATNLNDRAREQILRQM